MSLPLTEAFKAAAAVLPTSQWTKAVGLSAQTLNTDGSGHGKASGIDASFDVFVFRSDETFTADQWCAVFIAGGLSAGNNSAELTLRAANDGGTGKFTGYTIFTDGAGTGTGASRWVDGVETSLGTFSPAQTFATGDEMGAAVSTNASGNAVISLYKNRVLVASITDSTAPIVRPGAIGAGVFNVTANNVLLGGYRGGVGTFPGQLAQKPRTRIPGKHTARARLRFRSIQAFDAGIVVQSAGGTAIGIAAAVSDTELEEAASATGVAVEASDTQLLASGSAIGIAAATATDQEAEHGSAIGVATASASAQLFEAAAGSGVGIAATNTQLLSDAAATGTAIASATDQEAEAAAGSGVSIAGADSQLEVSASAVGEGLASLDIPASVSSAIGVANASADSILFAGASAAGEADAAFDTPAPTPALVTDAGDGLPGYRSAPWVHLRAEPMIGGGHAVGSATAMAQAIELLIAETAVISPIQEDDDLEMMFMLAVA